ncbi:Hypothetical protein, putative, partial [Bodo saltans]
RNAGGGFHGHPADYAIRYVHCTIAHDVTQQLALRRVGAYRMRDKVVLRQHQDRTIFSSIKAVMRPFLQSLFQQWRAITRRHRALKTAIGSLLVLSSDREVTRRCVQRWLFTSRTVHYGVNIAQDMRHEDDLSPSNAMLQRLAMAAMENALTSSMSSTIVSGVGAGAFPPPGASIPSSLPPYVPAALISPRGSLLVRDSNEVSLDRNVGAPPFAIGRRLSAVVVEDSELEPPAALVKPLKSPRGTTTSVGALLPNARRVSTVFVNDETPGVTTPQVPPPLAVFRIAPSSPPLPGPPGALPGTGSSESTSEKKNTKMIYHLPMQCSNGLRWRRWRTPSLRRMSSTMVSGAGAFPPSGASIPSSLPPYVPAALISPRGSLLVRDSNEVSLDRNVGAPPIAIGRRLSAVVVEDSELEPPAALAKPLKSPRGTTTTSVGSLLPTARRVSTVFLNDETPGATTPQVPPPLAVFRIAPSSPLLPGPPGALPGTGSSESTSGRGGRLDGSTLALSTSAAVSPVSGRDNPMLAPTMKQHPIQFPFSPLIHGVAKMSTENMFSPMVSPRFTAMGGRASLTSAQQQQMFNSTNPDSVLSGSVRDGNLSCDPMSFNTSNPAHLAAFNVSNPAGISLKLMGSLRSPKRGSVSIPGHRFNTSMQGGSNAASPSHSISTVQGSVFDPKKPSERHRRLAMIVNGLQRSVEHRNKMIAEFEYTHRAAMEERTEQLTEMVETYTKASERIGTAFRSVLDYMYPLVPSPLMGNAMILHDLGSGSLSYNKDGSLNLLTGPDGVAQDLSFPPHQRTGGSIAAPAGDRDESFLFPGQIIPPIDMRPLAEAGSEAKKSQQRVREAETAHLYGQPRKKQSTDTETVLQSKLNKNTRNNPTPSSMMVDRNSSSPSALKRNHMITLQDAEGEHDREMFRRQERIFNWLMHLAKHDVGSAGARLGTFLNRCCSDRTANLTLSVVGRTSHLLPLVRLALMSLAPPSLTHFQLVDLFSEELLTKASVVAAAPPPASKTNEYPLSLKLGRQSQEGSLSVRSAGAVTLPPSDPSETSSPTFATFEPPQQLGPLTQHDSPRHSVGDIAFSFLRKQSASGGGALGIVGSQSNLTGSSSGPNTRRGSQRRRSSVGFMLDTPRPEALMPELREESETQERRQSEQRRGSTFGGSAGGANGGGSGAGGRRRTINPTVGFRAFDSEGAPVANGGGSAGGSNNASPFAASLLNGGGSAGGSNNASPFAASLLMADSAMHTEDLNTAARRVSVAMQAFQQHHNSNHGAGQHPNGSLSVVVKSTRSRFKCPRNIFPAVPSDVAASICPRSCNCYRPTATRQSRQQQSPDSIHL